MVTSLSVLRRTLAVLVLLLSTVVASHAQNLAHVFSPVVREGSPGVDFRLGYDADLDRFAWRTHLQYGLSETWRTRVVLFGRGTNLSDAEAHWLRWENQWQFQQRDKHGWDSAFRVGLQMAEGDNLPSRVRLAWSSRWALGDGWEARFVALVGKQFGEGSDDSLRLSSRVKLGRRLSDKVTLGLDLYSSIGRHDDLGSFDEQDHQLGPILRVRFGSWNVDSSVLFGLSERAANEQYRFYLSRSW